MSRVWNKRESEILARYPVFNLRKDLCVSPRTGGDVSAYVLETRDWVNIVPVTPNRELVMVKQYRFGIERVTLEIPGGLSDPNDASMLDAARRELLEETGYDSHNIQPLGICHPNPAILNNTCHLFLARDVVLKREQNLDVGEDIEVERIPLNQVRERILDGTITHSLVLNALYLFDLHENRFDNSQCVL